MKKIITGVVALTMALSMTACSDSGENNNSTTTSTATETTTTTAITAESPKNSISFVSVTDEVSAAVISAVVVTVG